MWCTFSFQIIESKFLQIHSCFIACSNHQTAPPVDSICRPFFPLLCLNYSSSRPTSFHITFNIFKPYTHIQIPQKLSSSSSTKSRPRLTETDVWQKMPPKAKPQAQLYKVWCHESGCAHVNFYYTLKDNIGEGPCPEGKTVQWYALDTMFCRP